MRPVEYPIKSLQIAVKLMHTNAKYVVKSYQGQFLQIDSAQVCLQKRRNKEEYAREGLHLWEKLS